MHSFAPAGQSGVPALEVIVLNGRDAADRAWIEARSDLNDAVKAFVSKPPTHNDHAHFDFAMVLTMIRTDGATGAEPVGLSIVIEGHRVVTVCFGTDAIVEEAVEREASRGSATSVSRVLLLLVGVLIKELQPTLSRLAEQIDALEVAVMKGSNERMDDQAVLAGQQILALRRYLAPMYNELSYVALNPDELPGAAEPKYLRRAAELLARVINALDSSYHRVQIMLDQLRSRDAARLEQSIHKLTLVATVFLPMGFITGLLGINVAGIPDAHDPVAFWVVCAALIGVAIASILLIRWRKWM